MHPKKKGANPRLEAMHVPPEVRSSLWQTRFSRAPRSAETNQPVESRICPVTRRILATLPRHMIGLLFSEKSSAERDSLVERPSRRLKFWKIKSTAMWNRDDGQAMAIPAQMHSPGEMRHPRQ
jgi:hypothetical protein